MSNPRDLWPLRHLIRVMRRHDLTKKDLPTYLPTSLHPYIREHLSRAYLSMTLSFLMYMGNSASIHDLNFWSPIFDDNFFITTLDAKFWWQFWQFVWNFFTISKILTVWNVFDNSWQFWQFWMFSEFLKIFVTWSMTLKTLSNTLWPLNREWSWQYLQFLRRFMTMFDDIETIFDNWKDSPGDLTFETLITILTIENLNSVNHSYLTINCDTGQH